MICFFRPYSGIFFVLIILSRTPIIQRQFRTIPTRSMLSPHSAKLFKAFIRIICHRFAGCIATGSSPGFATRSRGHIFCWNVEHRSLKPLIERIKTGKPAGVLRVLIQPVIQVLNFLDQLRHRGLQLFDALPYTLHAPAQQLGFGQPIRLAEGAFDGYV